MEFLSLPSQKFVPTGESNLYRAVEANEAEDKGRNSFSDDDLIGVPKKSQFSPRWPRLISGEMPKTMRLIRKNEKIPEQHFESAAAKRLRKRLGCYSSIDANMAKLSKTEFHKKHSDLFSWGIDSVTQQLGTKFHGPAKQSVAITPHF